MKQPARSVFGITMLAFLLAACGGGVARQTFTAAEQAAAEIAGFSDVRHWADTAEALQTVEANRPAGELTYLALSGGGGDGAFGVGVLNGWTQRGDRPEFTVVSGVSTGALIAPFAFLGPAYDQTLRDMYTGGFGANLLDSPDLISAVFGSGAVDSKRIVEMSRKFLTPDMIAAIAREHRKGRRLLILTTNLDAQRGMLWDMGAIAASGAPGADELFRTVMAASASVPGVFTPTFISAVADGRQFQEMHVDGGVVANVFILPEQLLHHGVTRAETGKADVYVIMNGKLQPSFETVGGSVPAIAGRSLSTMLQTRSRATLTDTSNLARRNGVGFHLATIPADFQEAASAMAFDTKEMKRLYAYGYALGASGKAWASSPSGY
jgi:hypothetical protein